jgi:tRNA A-37 threonylcarbamoyl transferase component Bud32
MFVSTQKWLEWEMSCYQILYPKLVVKKYDSQTFLVEKMAGQSFLALLKANKLTGQHMRAAAKIFQSAHESYSPFFQQGWSHGDPHLENVLFDEKSDEAVLIDFETQHLQTLPTNERQADDLLVFCLDLIGRTPQFSSLLKLFLSTYDRPEILRTLESRLQLPQGFENILWLTRTHFLPRKLLSLRLKKLKELVHSLTTT